MIYFTLASKCSRHNAPPRFKLNIRYSFSKFSSQIWNSFFENWLLDEISRYKNMQIKKRKLEVRNIINLSFYYLFILQVSFSAQRLFTSLNPSECPVTIVGKLANLKKIQYADIANKFAPIDEKVHIFFLHTLDSRIDVAR